MEMGRKGFHGNGTVLTKHTGAKDMGGKGMAKFKGETKQKANSGFAEPCRYC